MFSREALARAILAKSRQIYMVHGTSSSFLRKILKQGLVPDPSARVWGDSEDPKESLGGVYFTTKLHNATMAALNAVRKFGGNELYVVAKIALRQPNIYLDEDIIPWTYFASVFKEDPSRAVPKKLADPGFLLAVTDGSFEAKVKGLVQDFIKSIKKDIFYLAELAGLDPQPCAKPLDKVLSRPDVQKSIEELIIASVRYVLAAHLEALNRYAKDNYMVHSEYASVIRYFGDKGEYLPKELRDIVVPDLKKIGLKSLLKVPFQQVRGEWREAMEAVLKKLRAVVPVALGLSADRESPPALTEDNARVTTTVGYRGANRIVGIYEKLLMDSEKSEKGYWVFRVHFERDAGAREWFSRMVEAHTGYKTKFVT